MATSVANVIVTELGWVLAGPVLLGAAIAGLGRTVIALVAVHAEVPHLPTSVLDVRLHSVCV